MLTMASATPPSEPLEVELRLHDARRAPARPYTYRLTWNTELQITREPAPSARARVAGDSSTWAGVLYDGVPLSEMEIDGDPEEIRRVVAAFAA